MYALSINGIVSLSKQVVAPHSHVIIPPYELQKGWGAVDRDTASSLSALRVGTTTREGISRCEDGPRWELPQAPKPLPRSQVPLGHRGRLVSTTVPPTTSMEYNDTPRAQAITNVVHISGRGSWIVLSRHCVSFIYVIRTRAVLMSKFPKIPTRPTFQLPVGREAWLHSRSSCAARVEALCVTCVPQYNYRLHQIAVAEWLTPSGNGAAVMVD
jgi:hypothetical protein